MTLTTSDKVKCQQLTKGHFSADETSVIIENELSVYISGTHLFTASITPSMEKEFVAGYLFGQGFINSIGDIASLEIKNDGAKVDFKNGKMISPKTANISYSIVSGGGKMAFIDSTKLEEIKSKIKLNKQMIFQGMNTLFEKAFLYRKTEGVHATGLFTSEVIPICIVEDIGRHNTLDKAIGYCLLHGIDFSNTFLVSTGRMSSEMVMKICRAGIPVAATKTALTDKGLEIAKKHGLTIIGFVRDIGTKTHTDMEIRISQKPEMKIYTNAERVTY